MLIASSFFFLIVSELFFVLRRSTSVQAAISEELKPQVKKLKTARSDLQQDKEASKAWFPAVMDLYQV